MSFDQKDASNRRLLSCLSNSLLDLETRKCPSSENWKCVRGNSVYHWKCLWHRKKFHVIPPSSHLDDVHTYIVGHGWGIFCCGGFNKVFCAADMIISILRNIKYFCRAARGNPFVWSKYIELDIALPSLDTYGITLITFWPWRPHCSSLMNQPWPK